jgi:hypothetical protein
MMTKKEMFAYLDSVKEDYIICDRDVKANFLYRLMVITQCDCDYIHDGADIEGEHYNQAWKCFGKTFVYAGDTADKNDITSLKLSGFRDKKQVQQFVDWLNDYGSDNFTELKITENKVDYGSKTLDCDVIIEQ